MVRADLHRAVTDDPAYLLTGLGDALAAWHQEADDLTGRSLAMIFEAFNSGLAAVAERAEARAGSEFDEAWIWISGNVKDVLTVLLEKIRAHQRRLDQRFTEIEERVPELLNMRTDDSLQECEAILDRIVGTINDLQAVAGQSSRKSSSTGAAAGVSPGMSKLVNTALARCFPSSLHIVHVTCSFTESVFSIDALSLVSIF